jgi:hypothetical protein
MASDIPTRLREQGVGDYSVSLWDEAADEIDRLRAEVAALKAAAKPLAERKVVQLIVLPQEGQTSNELYALCDDGTIWQRYEPQGWTQRLGIPQPEQPEQEVKP